MLHMNPCGSTVMSGTMVIHVLGQPLCYVSKCMYRVEYWNYCHLSLIIFYQLPCVISLMPIIMLQE